jgi:hypothetical protein
MPRNATAKRTTQRTSRRRTRSRGRRRWRLSRLWPSAKTRSRLFRLFKNAPATAQLLILIASILLIWFVANGIYQVVRKPTELFFPVSDVLHKSPTETWDSYGTIFRRHSTDIITPEFLAALAQVEASGNPIVRTYWKWSWGSDPFRIYKPASSAVGMYQITDGTFDASRKYCIRRHRVVEDGPWNDWESCWFNALYMRTIPSHAVEMTSAYLDRNVRLILGGRVARSSLAQKQRLAAVIHLCGAGAGASYARNGFGFTAGHRCGDHGAGGYIARVQAMQRTFARLSTAN